MSGVVDRLVGRMGDGMSHSLNLRQLYETLRAPVLLALGQFFSTCSSTKSQRVLVEISLSNELIKYIAFSATRTIASFAKFVILFVDFPETASLCTLYFAWAIKLF